jgi:hypothetical protein
MNCQRANEARGVLMDFVLEYLKKHNIPITRDAYINLSTFGDESGEDMLDAELEAALPQDLQHPDFREEK